MNAAIANVYFPDLTGKNEDQTISKRVDLLPGEELRLNLKGCVLNDRLCQKRIYTSFYRYAMTICGLYTKDYDDAVEILNDSFLKVFKEIHRYQPAHADVSLSFKGWLRKIIVYTAIDHYRKHRKYRFATELHPGLEKISSRSENAPDSITYNEIVRSMQKLTPGYRVILNLFVIESFSHEQISKQLGISVGTSKSNLAKGRRQLQKLLLRQGQINIPQRDRPAVP
jgi:RNA polymerase sigma-70 factor (ECF subfamily)